MNIFNWIEQELKPKACSSTEFIYNDMDSQSGRCLPVIYQPFNPANRSHWADRGSTLDFRFSTAGEKLLDFGPGDGWPSLLVAPFVKKVVGVDGSVRRVKVCTENARRLGITNTNFIHVAPGESLPFTDNSFDGVMAASSVEQTPDPKTILQEFFRVLKPGGRLRISYEALDEYHDGREREVCLWQVNEKSCRLILYDRHIVEEFVRQYSLTFKMSEHGIHEFLSQEKPVLSYDSITVTLLKELQPEIIDARICTTTHPSCETFVSWFKEIGFSEVIPSHSGAQFAARLFDQLDERQCPRDINGVDAMLRPLIKVVIVMPAPVSNDPMITAIK